MINPYATSFIIAARLDQALPKLSAKPRRPRWDAPAHWRETK